MKKIIAAIAALLLFATAAYGQGAGTVTNHAFALGKGPNVSGFTSLLCGSAQLAVGQAAADPICSAITGDVTLSAAGAITFNVVNANVGSFGSATQCVTVTVNAKGLITAASQTACTVAVGSISGLGAGCATWLATPSSANLRGCLNDETGTGLAYFQNGALGTPSSGVGTNLTGIPLTTGVVGALPVVNGGTNYTGGAWSTYTPTLSCGIGGPLTTASATGHSLIIGKLVVYNIDVVVTTNGTCASNLQVTMPSNAGFRSAATGRNNNTGRVVLGTIAAASNIFAMTLDAGTYPIADGQSITINGTYEAQ